MSLTLLELAANANIQDKLRTEVNDVLKKHNGSFTYESIFEMTYLNQVFNGSSFISDFLFSFHSQTLKNTINHV